MKSMTFRSALTSAALAASLLASGLASAAEPIIPPPPAPIVPPACRHWDKIVFKITDAKLAGQFKLIPNDPYDIKVQDNPKRVVDLKGRVLGFLNGPGKTYDPYDRAKVEIIDVEYALDCSLVGMLTPPPIELPK
ncbi:hypothetical protein [Methylotetracoccus oryzae]|uniref:hypothetical protein n=1 Tax=Methylotetracoccus oryzae TaxID=1919059 RepID=UPI001119C816|nr:hypothetical protein [Methylotetracoccus oryzae]